MHYPLTRDCNHVDALTDKHSHVAVVVAAAVIWGVIFRADTTAVSMKYCADHSARVLLYVRIYVADILASKRTHTCNFPPHTYVDSLYFAVSPVEMMHLSHVNAMLTSCARGDTICLRPLQVDNIFVFIRQVAPVPACWLFKTSATNKL